MKRLTNILRPAFIISMVLTFGYVGTGLAAALPLGDRQALELNNVYYRNGYVNFSGCDALNGVTPTAQPGPVYFVGDSIGTQIDAGLRTAFTASGWSYK